MLPASPPSHHPKRPRSRHHPKSGLVSHVLSQESADVFDDDNDDGHTSDSSSKRRRLSGGALSDTDTLYHLSPASRAQSLTPDLYPGYHPNHYVSLPSQPKFPPYSPLKKPVALTYAMNTPVFDSRPEKKSKPTTTDLEDWINLKELFARATELYESADPPSALPLVRAVIRECHRFIRAHPNPSVVYTHRSPPSSPKSRSKSRSRSRSLSPFASSKSRQPPRAQPHHHTDFDPDQPTAFHTLLGTSLLYIGTLLALDPELALPDEPREPATYWLAAVDVFEIGESLVSTAQDGDSGAVVCGGVKGDRTDAGDEHGGGQYGRYGLDLRGKREDWRMAMVWGHTLVALAEEKVRWAEKEKEARDKQTQAQMENRQGGLGPEQPNSVYFAPQAHAHSSFAPYSSPPYMLSPYTLSPLVPYSHPVHPGFYTAPTATGNPFTAPAPRWPPTSPFYAIAAAGAGATTTQRAGLARASAHEVLVLAMDQFSRGMLHMPRAGSRAASSVEVGMGGGRYRTGCGRRECTSEELAASPERPDRLHRRPSLRRAGPFSRARELHGIALALLDVAERLPAAAEREYWAGQADLVLAQMRMDVGVREVAGLAAADVGSNRDAPGGGGGVGEDEIDWRQGVDAARGRCWLVVGSARAEELEAGLELGELKVLRSGSAEEAREGLAMAIMFFERAKGSVNTQQDELALLLAEALLTLANLTIDENTREELYARAQAEGGDALRLDPPGLVEAGPLGVDDDSVEGGLAGIDDIAGVGSVCSDAEDERPGVGVGAAHVAAGRCGTGGGLLVLDEIHPDASRSSGRHLAGLAQDMEESVLGLGLNVGEEGGADWMDET